MKKLLAVLLSVLLACLCMAPAYASGETPAQTHSDSFGAYDRVFIIGVDGAGRFFKDVNTPNFDRIFADGAVDYTARTEMVTVSAQNWGSILSGVSYLRHGLTNDKAGETQRDSSTKYPTIFTYARRAFPEAELASIVHWDPINYGIIETDIGVNKMSPGNDEDVTNAICDYFDAGNAPTLFYCHFDDVDHAGHEHGSKSQEYISAIEAADARIGRVYDAIERNGLKEAAAECGKGIITFSPLAQGMLTNRYLNGVPADSRVRTDGRFLKEAYLTEEVLRKIRALNDLALQRGQSLAQMALAWVLRDEVVTSVLVGASRPEQILDSLKCTENLSFTAEELAYIDQNS